jgi:hypothetical protein
LIVTTRSRIPGMGLHETDFQLGGEILFLLVSFIADLTPR